jgi:CRISPR-associated protein Csx16
MTIYFVSRHAGAIEWASRQQLNADVQRTHLDPAEVQPGDLVYGTLPVPVAAAVCACGAEYWHLQANVPAQWRGKELTAEQLDQIGARFVRAEVRLLNTLNGA